MMHQEKESPDKQSEDRRAMCSPAVVQRQIDTGNKEDDERHPSVEHPFNAILSCSSHNYHGLPWHDSMNCCGSGIASNLRSSYRGSRMQRNNWNAKEEYVRSLRGNFTTRFGKGRDFGRRMFFFFPRACQSTTESDRTWRSMLVFAPRRCTASAWLRRHGILHCHAVRLREPGFVASDR
ncbi:hypothetical protein MRX96_008009 [Rhipicephalus microplus]